MTNWRKAVMAFDGFEEGKHPRDHGKFTSGGGSSGSSGSSKPAAKKPAAKAAASTGGTAVSRYAAGEHHPAIQKMLDAAGHGKDPGLRRDIADRAERSPDHASFKKRISVMLSDARMKGAMKTSMSNAIEQAAQSPEVYEHYKNLATKSVANEQALIEKTRADRAAGKLPPVKTRNDGTPRPMRQEPDAAQRTAHHAGEQARLEKAAAEYKAAGRNGPANLSLQAAKHHADAVQHFKSGDHYKANIASAKATNFTKGNEL